MEQNEVTVAFDMALEEIENAIDALNAQGSKAFEAGKYDVARDLLDKGSQMTTFRDKVKELQKEWVRIFESTDPILVRPKPSTRRKKVRRGLRTPEDEFKLPILQVLVEFGGSGQITDVLDRVGKMMADRLNAYDWQSLPSDPDIIRWRNTAQWARKALVDEGLMAAKSPRGIWEITGAGRKLVS